MPEDLSPPGVGGLEILRATEADLPEVLGLLTEAASWSRTVGIEGLWRVPYPAEWVLPSLRRHEVYLARWDGATAGTLTFRWDDRPTWGERPPEAAYVHKLAVRRSLKGLQIGARMLDWSGAKAAREGRAWLRLDCLRSHAILRSYYEALGFRRVREATVEGNVVTLLERPTPLDTEGPRPRSAKRRDGQY